MNVNPPSARDALALRDAISPARLTAFVRRSHNNLRAALDLYAWNVGAGAALYPMLQVNEVALRNAVDWALGSQFGSHWPYSPAFLRGLPGRERSTFEGGRAKLESDIKVRRVSTGDVVAAQSYWFWVMLLNSRFEQRIWRHEFSRSFPFAPPEVGRAVVHRQADALRRLRNRIAHHEPLLDYDLPAAQRRAAAMVRWISPAKAAWAAERWPLPRSALRARA